MFVDSILNEAETKDLLRIISIQNKPAQEVLNEVKEKFASKELLCCKALATMISSGLLNRSQRVASLVILIKNNIQMVNPFFCVLDQVFLSKELTVESNLVASLIGEVHVPSDVMKRTVKELIEWYNRPPMFTDPPSNYIEMRDAYVKACEEIKRNSAFEGDISNILQDVLCGSMKTHSPTDSLRFEDLLEQDLQGATFKPKLLTILPPEVPISDEELCWLMPFTTDCGQLVSGPEIKDLEATFMALIKKGTTNQYDPRDKSLLTELIVEKPDFLAKNNALSDNICNIIDKQNEDMASFMLLVLGDTNEPLLNKCLEIIHEKDWNGEGAALGVVQNLAKNFKLPQAYLDSFLINFWKSVQKHKDDPSKFNPKVRIFATFMKYLIQKGLFDPTVKYQVWVELCSSNASSSSAVADLFKILQKSGDQKSDN